MKTALLLTLLLSSISAQAAEVCFEGEPSAGALPTLDGFCFPAFEGEVKPLSEAHRLKMTPVVWREECPVDLDDLWVVRVKHWTLADDAAWGEIVVASKVAEAVLGVFKSLWNERFPIAQMQPVEVFDGNDVRSMEANNTSAFNCRPVAGSKRFSRHAYGEAVDINPLQNPYVRGAKVSPPSGKRYADRALVEPGSVVDGGPVVRAFARAGWKWGGRWKRSKDWQHFSTDGT